MAGQKKLSFYGKTTCCFTQHPEMQTKEANNKTKQIPPMKVQVNTIYRFSKQEQNIHKVWWQLL